MKDLVFNKILKGMESNLCEIHKQQKVIYCMGENCKKELCAICAFEHQGEGHNVQNDKDIKQKIEEITKKNIEILEKEKASINEFDKVMEEKKNAESKVIAELEKFCEEAIEKTVKKQIKDLKEKEFFKTNSELFNKTKEKIQKESQLKLKSCQENLEKLKTPSSTFSQLLSVFKELKEELPDDQIEIEIGNIKKIEVKNFEFYRKEIVESKAFKRLADDTNEEELETKNSK